MILRKYNSKHQNSIKVNLKVMIVQEKVELQFQQIIISIKWTKKPEWINIQV